MASRARHPASGGPAPVAGDPPTTVDVVAHVDGVDRFLPVTEVVALSCAEVRTASDPGSFGRFERRAGEVLLSRDLSARHLIDLEGPRLVRANEIELGCVEGRWEVIGVDPSSKPVLRRVLPRSWRQRVRAGGIVDWAEIEPFVGHVPTARLRIPFRKLARLHPAQLADLVEAASQEEGEEILRAVGADRALEADVFEELDPEHQVDLLRSRSDEEAARVLSAMAPDDAVDLLTELDQDRRLPILQRLPAATQAKLRRLLTYHPETAGGLMNPDFVALEEDRSVAGALDEVRASSAPPGPPPSSPPPSSTPPCGSRPGPPPGTSRASSTWRPRSTATEPSIPAAWPSSSTSGCRSSRS